MRYIYKITDLLNNKVYIGQTTNVDRRWSAHKSFAKNPEKTGQYIHRAMAKYGIENFTFEIVATCLTQEDTDETETQLIAQYDSRNKEKGYNRAPGGNIAWESGLPSHMYPMYGKHHTNESKEEIRQSQIGKVNSVESITKMSEAGKKRKGIIHKKHKSSTWVSDEDRQKIIEEYTTGTVSLSQLAIKYRYSISCILRQIKWGNGSRVRKTRSKLTQLIVDTIREDYATGLITIKELAIKYHSNDRTIGRIIHDKNYKGNNE